MDDMVQVGWVPYHKTDGFDMDAIEGGEGLPRNWTMSPGWQWVAVYAKLPAPTGEKP
jgi:hypothetical protein